MSMIQSDLLLGQEGGAGYTIPRSLRFSSSDSAYLSRTPASAGNRKTWTWAGWVKRSSFGSNHHLMRVNAGLETAIRFRAEDDTLMFYTFNGSSNTSDLRTAAVFRDPSAWYHIVVAVDTTQATASNRVRFYVNGVEQTAFSVATYPTQNLDTGINQAALHALGAAPNPTEYFNGYLADVHLIDGQQLTPSSFGQFDANGIWQPKAYTGTYGTNGFRLDFSDNSAATATTLGKDRAGSNNWTPNNLSVTAGAGNDSLIDSPVNGSQVDTGAGGEVRGNYCTLNPLDKGSAVTLANGNLDLSVSGTHNLVAGTIMVSSGKYYAEYVATSLNSGAGLVGVCNPLASRSSYLGGTNGGVGFGFSGDKWVDGSVTGGVSGGATTGDVIGIALDKDNNQVSFYKNNTLQFTQTGLNSSQPYTFAYGHLNSGGYFNFGQRPFAYPAPSGFKALCTANLPTSTGVVAQPSTAMDVKLYTGNGSTQTISGLGFSPDLVWAKSRSTTDDNRLTDIVRGATKELFSNLTNAEGTDTNGVTSFNSDGWTLGSSVYQNGSGKSFVAWAWDAGSSTVTNTQGSITSSVRANPSAGFSIVTYTGNATAGATVGHGLNAPLGLYILKNRDAAEPWLVFGSAIDSTGANGVLILNSTSARTTSATTTATTSTTFPLSQYADANGNGQRIVAYCFAPVAGYSSFGSYTGNGSSDGPFVWCGFRPRWLLIKFASGANSWMMQDSVRDTYNPCPLSLIANGSRAEEDYKSSLPNDMLSNGFKLRTANDAWNGNGGTYIYAAFAESPFQFARAR